MRPVLRAAFGYAPTATSVTWTDITRWLNLKASVRVSRGASDELTQTQPSLMSLTLDNEDGRFSSGLASSPYYPYVRPNCPIQLGVLTGGKNLAQSPSFEGGVTTGWAASTSTPPLAVAADGTRAHSGTQSLLIDWQSTGTGGVVEQIVYDLRIGQTYTLSGWVWVPAGDAAVRWKLVDTGAVGTASAVTAAWTQISLTFTATSTSHTIGITTAASPPAAGDRVWLDDVQVESGASVTSFDSAGTVIHWRFYGMVNGWKSTWRGLEPVVVLTATDLFKHLNKQPQLGSLLAEEIKQAQPVIYYPLTEPSTSTSAGDVAGTGGGSLVQAQVGSGGTVTFGQQDGPPATGATAVTFAPASASNGIRLDADMGPAATASTTTDFIKFECWFKTTTANRQFYHCRDETFQYQIAFTLNASGYLTIEHTDVGGTRTASVIGSTNLADGQWHHVVYTEYLKDVYIDGGAPIDVIFLPFMYALKYMTIGGNTGALWEGSVAHAVLYTGTAVDSALLAAHYDAGANGFSGEDADERMLRLAGYAGIASIDAQGDFSPVDSQGPGGSSALEMMRVVEATEAGKLVSHRDGHGLLFQSRTVRYNAPVAVSMAFADLETDEASLPTDDQKQVNQLTARRPGGATQRVVSAESVAAFGPYPKDLSIIKTSDTEAVDAAHWIVSRYAVPEPELREVPVKAYSLPAATYAALLEADISSVLEITALPDEAPAPTTTATIEGYSEELGLNSHFIQFHTSRAQIGAVWGLDHTTYSVLGTTTRLAY
ncbi:carbohydrate binding domain-containing protein [Streptomyces erythrochromogenes]|uniref:Carbohydrate binding domain-containing protein n=1 Tax=Streptomyces erythrochromogenes TaxID=285574 RepID=A0ABZ1QF67_9ACTN|nr:carbohydrate binding domain-containing protein [Streptomyces erythrochromogenes]